MRIQVQVYLCTHSSCLASLLFGFLPYSLPFTLVERTLMH
jgi:hypothetical protein